MYLWTSVILQWGCVQYMQKYVEIHNNYINIKDILLYKITEN